MRPHSLLQSFVEHSKLLFCQPPGERPVAENATHLCFSPVCGIFAPTFVTPFHVISGGKAFADHAFDQHFTEYLRVCKARKHIAYFHLSIYIMSYLYKIYLNHIPCMKSGVFIRYQPYPGHNDIKGKSLCPMYGAFL